MRSPGKHSARLLRWTTRRVALPMAQTPAVEGRLRAVLDQRNRTMLTKRTLWLGGGVALLVLLPLAALRPRPASVPGGAAALGAAPPLLAWQAPLPKTTLVAPPGQEVTLPDGIRVKLLGSAQNPSRDAPWSTPDGRAGIKSPYLSANEVHNGSDSLNREFAVYLDGLRRLGPAGADFAAAPVPGASGSAGIAAYVKRGDSFPARNLQAVVASFPRTGRGDQTGAFLFGVAAGPWQTAVAKSFTNGASTSTATNSSAAILIGTSRDVSRPLIASVADDVDPALETRIVAVDRHGRLHVPDLLDGGGSGTTAFSGATSLDDALRSYHNLHQSLVTFPGLPLRDVREVRFQTRPYQWVLFQNLALYPQLAPPGGPHDRA